MLKRAEFYPLLRMPPAFPVFRRASNIFANPERLLKPWEWGARVLQAFELQLRGNLGVMFPLIWERATALPSPELLEALLWTSV